MNIFLSTLNQIAFLFALIVAGYLLVRTKVLSADSAKVLSKLENTIFIPALVLGTFIDNFTAERISASINLFLISFIVALIAIPFAIFVSKAITKDKYIQNIYTYGLSFSNFGFMGNAVVNSLFPDVFFEYLIFTLPLWIFIYLWGVPRLLMSSVNEKHSLKQSLKSFINPMFIAMLIGMVIGFIGIPIPSWIKSVIKVSGDCMSPIAMILTGIVVSSISLKKTFTNVKIYIVSIIRLIIMPLIFMVISRFINMSETIYLCALCSLAMPLGLNTIVIPSAYGKDTSEAAGMALISHLLSCATIPLMFSLV